MVYTIITLETGKQYFLKGFKKDNAGPIPYDGTHGPYCMVTGEALVYRMKNGKTVDNGNEAKVAVKTECAGLGIIADGIYTSKTFEEIVYLEKEFK